MTGRAQRRVAAEQAERRKRLVWVGGAVAVLAIVALVAFLLTRPQEAGPPVLAAEPMPGSIPVEGHAMGAAEAPVTVVEWGDYT